MKKYPELGSGSGNVLGHLARKPEAFRESKSDIIGKPIKLVKNLYSWMFITNQPFENKHQIPGSGRAPEVLDQKPEASSEKKSNILGRTIKSGKHLYALMFISHQPSKNKHPEPGSGRLHEDLDGKAEVYTETISNIIGRIIKPGKNLYLHINHLNIISSF